MHQFERALLKAWSNQLAGAGPRLARRAWAILEDHNRTNPVDLSAAWGDPSDLHRWLMNYRRFGPAGLLDAMRPGRPRSVGLAADELLRGSHGGAADAWLAAERSVKEAAWRQLRAKGGERVVRRGRSLDVPLPVHPGLRDLVAVFADGRGLTVVATFDRLDDYIESYSGTWVGVPSSITGKAQEIQHTLTEALDIRLPKTEPGSAASRTGIRTKLDRLSERLADFGRLRSGALQVFVVVDLLQGRHLPDLLQHFRKHGIWTSSTLAPSTVKLVAFAVHESSPGAGLQLTLPRALEKSDATQLGNLVDGLRSKREHPFLWIRALIQEPTELQFDQVDTDDVEC